MAGHINRVIAGNGWTRTGEKKPETIQCAKKEDVMKKMLSVISFWLLLVITAYSQQGSDAQGTGYMFFAPGTTSESHVATLQFGGGGNYRSSLGLGGGVDVSYLTPRVSMGDGMGTLSPYLYYSFLKPKSKIEPFVSGGYTLFFRNGSANGINFGGGIHYWFTKKVALKLEFHDDVMLSSYHNAHFVGFRMGVAFR
jgi:hypothetical protein